MLATATEAPTLRQMRETANGGQGLSAQQVADQVAKILNEGSRTGESIVNIERRGTRDRFIVSALAQVYDKKLEEVSSAAAPTGNK